jgi:sarcosine oxidase subunit beta
MQRAIVIGGGVLGVACAAELAARRIATTVLEAAPSIGQGSSSRANGGVRAQFATAANIAFSVFSIERYEWIERRTGLLSFHQTGYLLMTGTPEGEQALRTAAELQRSLGAGTEWLAPDEVTQRHPILRAEGLRGATFHARDGFLDPAGAVAALGREAIEGGATIRTDADVVAIERAGEGFIVTLATRERLEADVVVNAAGVDARAVARLVGGDVPVEPIRRNLAHILEPSAAGGLTPMLVDTDTGVLARREPAGGWIAAYSNPADPPGRDTTVDPRFFDDLVERLPNRFPFLLDLPIDPARCWAGLYPESPDHQAILGSDPDVEGLFHAVGFGGHGIMHAPAAGRAIGELVADGHSSFDLRAFRPERFVEGDVSVESAVF